jgi:hypothetical protein
VSEGIAYGMMLAAYVDDQDTFDALWLYAKEFEDEHGLMYWYIDPTGTVTCPGEETVLPLVIRDFLGPPEKGKARRPHGSQSPSLHP